MELAPSVRSQLRLLPSTSPDCVLANSALPWSFQTLLCVASMVHSCQVPLRKAAGSSATCRRTGRRSAYVFAAAARAAGRLGPEARAALPYLLKPLTRDISDNVVTFESFSSHQSSTRDYTNCLIEAIRALARMGAEARSALPFLQELSKPDPFARDNPNRLMRLPNVAEEARSAIKAIEG